VGLWCVVPISLKLLNAD
jgi:hypothetical protein